MGIWHRDLQPLARGAAHKAAAAPAAGTPAALAAEE